MHTSANIIDYFCTRLPPMNFKKIAKIVKDEMEKAMQLDVPLKVDVKISKCWE